MSGFENIRDAALRAAAACLAIGFASVQSASAQEDAKTTAQNYADCPQEFSADAAIPACWCDPNPTGRIWGTDIYTNDSNICVAAAHAGVISADEGGVISVIPQPGQSSYSALIRNGVHSDSYGSWDASFSVSPVENVELAQQASGAAAEEKRSNQASLTEVQPETPSELTEACNAVDDQYKELYEKLFSSLSVSDLTRLSELHNTFWGATAWLFSTTICVNRTLKFLRSNKKNFKR